MEKFKVKVSEPVIISIFLLILYGLFIILSYYLSILISQIFLFEFAILNFIIQFFSSAILWLFLIPCIFNLPEKNSKFNEYIYWIGLKKFKPLLFNLSIAIVSTIIIIIFYLIATLLTAGFIFDINQILPPNSYCLITSFNPGIWEEIAFRGVIIAILNRKYSEKKVIIFNSVLFSLSHLSNFLLFSESLLNTTVQIYSTFFFSLIISYIFIKTKSLLPCIIIHYLNNAFELLFTYAPNADPVIQNILMVIIGSGIIPFILILFLTKLFLKFKNNEKDLDLHNFY